MTMWYEKARLTSIEGVHLGLWGGHTLEGTTSNQLLLEKGAQSAHFLFYWTEDSSVYSTNAAGSARTNHHVESADLGGVTFEPSDLVQALANTMECCWEMLFTPWAWGPYGFRELPRLRSNTTDGRIPVYLSALTTTAAASGKAAHNPWLQLDRRVPHDLHPEYSSKQHAILKHDTPMHELFHLVQYEYLGGSGGGVDWLVEGMAAWSQRLWRGYRSGPIPIGQRYNDWKGIDSVLDSNASIHYSSGWHYVVSEFWDMLGRKFTRLSPAARIKLPLCAELDARKDVYPGTDIMREVLTRLSASDGVAGSDALTRTRAAVEEVTAVRGTEISFEDLEWEFLTKDWQGLDDVACLEFDNMIKIFARDRGEPTSSSSLKNLLERGTLVSSDYTEGSTVNWQDLGGQITSSPAICRFDNYGRQQYHVFARGLDDSICTNSLINDVWIGWNSLRGQLDGDRLILSPPAATVYNNGGLDQIHVFARGRGGELRQAFFTGMHWRGMFSFPGTVVRGRPSTAAYSNPTTGNDELYVFVWGGDRFLYWSFFSPPTGWSSWYSFRNEMYTSSPSAVMYENAGNRQVHVFIRDENHHLRQYYLDEHNDWRHTSGGFDLGGNLGSGPVAAVMGRTPHDDLYIFARRRSDGNVIERKYYRVGQGWSNWANIT